MIEPPNHTALVDKGGDTWVRYDEGGSFGPWFPLTDGPGWDEWARDGVGYSRPWSWVEEHGPFTEADSERAARALDRVRREVAR
jgi:hypothetical protein